MSTTAIGYFQQALDIAQQLPKRDNEIAILQTLTITYQELENYAKAIEFAQQALVRARANNDYKAEKSLLVMLAEIYKDNLQDYAKAIEFYQQALVRARAENDQQSERGLLITLAELYEKMPAPR